MPATLESRIPAIIQEANARTVIAVRSNALKIEYGSKERSRVDTGEMRNGWRTEDRGVMESEVFNPVSHTIFNEFGTVYMEAQPMLLPSVEETWPEFVRDIQAAWSL